MTEDEIVARLIRLAGRRKPVPAARAARVRAVVREEWREVTRSRRRRRSIARLAWFFAAAATVFAALALAGWKAEVGPWAPPPPVGVVEVVDGPSGLSPGLELLPGAVIETGPEGRMAIRLRQGHSVRLDRDTLLRIGSNARLALESGAVYADSGPGRAATGSVTVTTRFGSVRDIGTQFEVRVSESATRVRVREGLVEMEHSGGMETARAGTEVEVDGDGNLRRAAVPVGGPEWGWVTAIAPPFDLDGASLSEFLAWVSRETGLRVVYQDASTAAAAPGISLSGSVEGLTPEEALAAVLPTCGLVHRVEGGDLYLSPGS